MLSKCIKSDNSTEMTSRVVLQWALEHNVEWHYITPGRPMENGFTEFQRGWDEFLNENIFSTLTEAQHLAAEWLYDYNHVRPPGLNYLAPMEFLKQQEADGARLLAVAPSASCCRNHPRYLQKDSTCRWYIIGGQVSAPDLSPVPHHIQ